ncbi:MULTISPECIES: fimbrial protein [unclassified Pseudomonas]|uniref:fimbrial protein n=1 Tax=unclassified Pseudomonas TaxID=196821 RepID=UPI000A1DDB1A|nr:MULTISPECIES: fimbrial protein [unclassified Pseudomonas]
MNAFPRCPLLPTLLLASLPLIHLPAAYAASGCKIINGPGPATFTANFNDVWVPRDLPVGEPITHLRVPVVDDPGNRVVECHNSADRLLEAHADYTTPFAHDVPVRLGNGRFANRVIRTRIPGVGAVVELDHPFSGGAPNTFTPSTGSTLLPYSGTNMTSMAVPIQIGPISMSVTLVKIGSIAAGPIMLDEEVARGSTSDAADAFRLRISGNLNQAQCTLKSDAVSADPVDLGSHTVADFPVKGTTTASMPFHITLSDCEDDPASSTATAHIYLTGTDGSVALDPKQGLFSLGNGSTAKGIGIQITDDLGIPVPLAEHVSTNKKLELPVTRLPYRAHFYQTDDRVTPGVAKGALDFTISYR